MEPPKTGNRAGGLRQCRAAESGRRASSQAFQATLAAGQRGPKRSRSRRIILGVREAARELTLDAIDTLATIMKDPKAPAAARISAAVALLDRGHGRPYQAVDVKDEVDLGLLSDEELYTLDADPFSRVRARPRSKPTLPHSTLRRGPRAEAHRLPPLVETSGRRSISRRSAARRPHRDGGNIPAARRDADILHGQLNQLQRLLSLAMAEPTLSALPGPDPAH